MKRGRCSRQARGLEWELTAPSIPSAFQMWITSWGQYIIENVGKGRGSFSIEKLLLHLSAIAAIRPTTEKFFIFYFSDSQIVLV